MTIELLVAAVNKEVHALADTMRICSDAIIINQCGENNYDFFEKEGYHIRAYGTDERGVGLSRNQALLRASADISLFGDEDIVYADGYADIVTGAFEKHPDADVLLFNVDVAPDRRTYHIENFHKVGKMNCGRYPAYSIAIRTSRMHAANLTFSLLFGGGAKYANGEDSLFLRDCVKKGLRIYAVPERIGEEIPRPSTWFDGYNEKFFHDRGVLYHFLYGRLAGVWARRFILAKKSYMCKEIQPSRALKLMKEGIAEAKKL